MKLSDEELLKIGFDRKAFMETPLSTSFEWNERTFVYVMHSAAFHKVGVAATRRSAKVHGEFGNE